MGRPNSSWISSAIRGIVGGKNYIKARIKFEKIKQRRRAVGSSKIDRFLDQYSRVHRGLSFVQIGSSDGVFGDPIHTYIVRDKWTGLLVEPIPQVFELLQYSYRGNTLLKFENCAVGPETGIAPFYLPPLEAFWRHYGASQRSSFHKREGYVKVDIRVLSFPKLLESHGIDKVQLIHTDTEGYDFEILKNVDFDRYGTEVVLFEHVHLGNSLNECYSTLQRWGFTLIKGDQDTLAHRIL
jgi:FkbM family methyltransferase